jgi:hypothetical protein
MVKRPLSDRGEDAFPAGETDWRWGETLRFNISEILSGVKVHVNQSFC